ncbi:MAG: DUF1987 domain-containing protein [Bacteroidales bacterium]|nr:DUF1987 domain-containing protein [Bacteroidales bacterium]
MNNLFIEGSGTIPEVELRVDGYIKIAGRALMENAHDFFQPIKVWVKEFSIENLEIEINLEYFNTTVSKHLHDVLKIINENEKYGVINLKWHYEEGDDEILESGEIYDELFHRINFTYHPYAEIFD